MQNYREILGDIRLIDLRIPGSHNANTSSLDHWYANETMDN